jgi:hypothetical protein
VPGDTGVLLTAVAAGAQVNLFNMNLENMDRGLVVSGGAADVTFQGLIESTASAGPGLLIENTTGGAISLNRTTDRLQTAVARNDAFVVSYGIIDRNSQAAAAVTVDGTSDTRIRVGQTQITGASQAGVLVENNAASDITLTDVRIERSGAQAFLTQANDAASLVTINGSSRLGSESDTVPAFQSNDAAVLNIQLNSLDSAVQAATNGAISLQGVSTGFLTITDSFRVANPTPPPPAVPGTVVADVTNTTPVIVTVPAP